MERENILVVNDDGVNSPGLWQLVDALAEIANVKVVAPDRDLSGASSSLTITRPLKAIKTANGFMSVDGTPADCVHLGLNDLFDCEFDRVVSGINTHANLGDDVLYSGTVAGAIEGRFLNKPAIAVSLQHRGREHYETAANLVKKLLMNSQSMDVASNTVLNINVPDLPEEKIAGVEVTRLGHRATGAMPQKFIDPRGNERYWIGAAGDGEDAGQGTDFCALVENKVSITPLHADMTRYVELSQLNIWLDEVEFEF